MRSVIALFHCNFIHGAFSNDAVPEWDRRAGRVAKTQEHDIRLTSFLQRDISKELPSILQSGLIATGSVAIPPDLCSTRPALMACGAYKRQKVEGYCTKNADDPDCEDLFHCESCINGTCDRGRCVCKPGYSGIECEKEPVAPYFSRSESKASQNATMKSMASKRRLSLLHPTAMMSGGQHGVKAPRLRATQESPNFLKLNTRLLTIEEKLNRIMTHLSMSTSNPTISASFGNQNTSIALSDVSEMVAKNAAAGQGGSRRGSAGTSFGAPTRRRSDIVPQQHIVAQSLDIPQDAHHQNSNHIRSARHISHPSSAGYGAGTKRSMSVTSTTGFHNPGKRQSLTYGASSTSVSQNLTKSTHDFLDYANMKHRAVEPPAVGNSTAIGYLTGMMNSLSGNTYSRRGSVSSRVGHSAIDRLDGVLKSPAASRRGSSRTTSSNSTNSKVNKMNQINDRLGALQLGKVVNTSSMEFELNKSPSGTPSASPSKTNIMPPRDDYQDGIGAKKSGNTMSPSPSLGSSYPLADVHRNRTN